MAGVTWVQLQATVTAGKGTFSVLNKISVKLCANSNIYHWSSFLVFLLFRNCDWKHSSLSSIPDVKQSIITIIWVCVRKMQQFKKQKHLKKNHLPHTSKLELSVFHSKFCTFSFANQLRTSWNSAITIIHTIFDGKRNKLQTNFTQFTKFSVVVRPNAKSCFPCSHAEWLEKKLA